MGAILDLFKSERGFICLAVLICATVVFSLGRLTADQWMTMTEWIVGIYVGGKSVTSGIETLSRAKTAVAQAATPAPAAVIPAGETASAPSS